MKNGTPGEIRTPDRSVRSRVLYPAELRALNLADYYNLVFIFVNEIVAEREGFEPSMGFNTHTPLAGERLQPLGHLSFFTYSSEPVNPEDSPVNPADSACSFLILS